MPTGFTVPDVLDPSRSRVGALRYGGPQRSAAPMPSARTQAEIDALRGTDALKAQQMAKDMYSQRYPQSTGLIGIGVDLARRGKKDERMQGFQDQAMQGLTQARAAQEEQRMREARDANAMMQYENQTDQIAASTEQENLNRRSAADRAGRMDIAEFNQGAQDARQVVTQGGLNTRATQQIEATAAGRAGVTYYNPGGRGFITTRVDGDGREYTRDETGKRTYRDTTEWQVYKTGDQGSNREDRYAADNSLERDVQDMRALTTASTLGHVLSSDQFAQTVGPLEVRRAFARQFPLGEQGRERQSVLKNIENARTDLFGPVLEMLGVNPTDKDAEIAFATVPGVNDDPQVWTNYVRDIFAPRTQRLMLTRLKRSEADGSTPMFTREQITETYNSLMDMADETDIKLGYMENNGLKKVGNMTPEEIEAEITELQSKGP